MKRLFLLAAQLALLPIVVGIGSGRALAADPPSSVPDQLLQIQKALDVLSSEIAAIKSQLDAGITEKRRKFYIPKGSYDTGQGLYDGAHAPSACASGFHMANLFEILDPTSLEYDTALGWTRDDSGYGPPSYIRAWVRTGQDAFAGEGSAVGYANCNAYTSADPSNRGVIVGLSRSWRFDPEQPADQHRNYVADWWVPIAVDCDGHYPVWCVEDP